MMDSDFESMSEFSCGVEELDYFFKCEIRECVEHRYLSAYCAYTEKDGIVAVFTLMNDAVMISTNEKEDFFDDLRLEECSATVDFFKKQSSFPAINIGHLGTSVKFQDKGIGTTIIEFVVGTYSQYRQAGCQFVTVDALNNKDTIRFYLKNYFNFQTNRDLYSATRRMYRILNP